MWREDKSCLEVDLIKMVRMDGSEVVLEGLACFVSDDMQQTFLGEIEDSGRIDEDGSHPDDWVDSYLGNFSKFLGMLMVGYEAEILNLLRKLNVRKEINNQSTLLGK